MKKDKKKIKKSLGQHYLVNKNILKKIATSAGKSNPAIIVEIGAGTGLLTRELLATKTKVHAIEIEKESLDELRENFISARSALPENLSLEHANALEINYDELITKISSNKKICANQKWTICGNLPYNIASKLIVKILEDINKLFFIVKQKPENFRMIFLIQKEVAKKLVGLEKKKSPLSYLIAWHGQSKCLFDIQPGSFFPPPKIISSIIEIIPQSQSLEKEIYLIYKDCLKISFQKRRKMIGNVLKQSFPKETLALEKFFLIHKNLETKRAGEWTAEQYIKLAKHLKQYK